MTILASLGLTGVAILFVFLFLSFLPVIARPLFCLQFEGFPELDRLGVMRLEEVPRSDYLLLDYSNGFNLPSLVLSS